ncbi:MAG: uroporphyrinogen decarboxylase family protein [Bacteroidales bacterium]
MISHPLLEGVEIEDLQVPDPSDGRIPVVLEDPDHIHKLMRFATDVALFMSKEYIDAGCDVVAMVDPMTSQIDPFSFETFVSPYAVEIFESIREAGALSSFFVCGNAQQNFERAVKMLTRTRHQVMIADVVLLNKTDLAPEEADPVRHAVETMNPFAEVVETHYCRLDLDRYILGVSPEHLAAMQYGMKESGEGPISRRACWGSTNPFLPKGSGFLLKDCRRSVRESRGM